MGLLDGKVALVTGSGHGIGRAHALELAKQGARVVVNDLGSSASGEGSGRDADLPSRSSPPGAATAVADYGDVGDEAQAAAMVARAVETWGRLDVVVNNAGIVRDRAVWNMDVDDFDLVMRVHVRGTWLPVARGGPSLARAAKAGRPGRRSHRQHGLRRRAGRQLRPVQLRHRQGGDHRPHPDPAASSWPASG